MIEKQNRTQRSTNKMKLEDFDGSDDFLPFSLYLSSLLSFFVFNRKLSVIDIDDK